MKIFTALMALAFIGLVFLGEYMWIASAEEVSILRLQKDFWPPDTVGINEPGREEMSICLESVRGDPVIVMSDCADRFFRLVGADESGRVQLGGSPMRVKIVQRWWTNQLTVMK